MADIISMVMLFLVAAGCFGTAYLMERANKKKTSRRDRQRLHDAAVDQYVTMRERKHNTMRQIRDIARDHRTK